MNYYLNPAISNSSLSYIDPEVGGCPQKFKDYVDGKLESESTPSLEKGDYIHQYILTPEDFKTLTIEMPKPGVKDVIGKVFYEISHGLTAEQMSQLSLGKYPQQIMAKANECGYQTNWKNETRLAKLLEEGTVYFDALKVCGDKTVLDAELYETIKACAESIQRNDAAHMLLIDSPGQECFNEMEIYWDEEWKGMKLTFKAKLDRFVVDHKEKTFSIIDFKTTSKHIHAFPESVQFYRYYRQISFYDHAVKFWLEKNGYVGYKADEHFIVAVETKGYHNSRVFVISDPYQKKGRKETAALLNRIIYHYSTGDWVKPMEEQMTEYKTYILEPVE